MFVLVRALENLAAAQVISFVDLTLGEAYVEHPDRIIFVSGTVGMSGAFVMSGAMLIAGARAAAVLVSGAFVMSGAVLIAGTRAAAVLVSGAFVMSGTVLIAGTRAVVTVSVSLPFVCTTARVSMLLSRMSTVLARADHHPATRHCRDKP
jgi:hypothetical protein